MTIIVPVRINDGIVDGGYMHSNSTVDDDSL
jgi:hypothetical protein